jgi:hypothetical protein
MLETTTLKMNFMGEISLKASYDQGKKNHAIHIE